jgi:predicted lipoprotein with Yx(FWY)xxD motif
MRIWMALLVAAAVGVLAGCGGSSSGSSDSGSETVIATRQVESGLELTTADDQTLYTFTGDSCDGSCADVWKPMVAEGKVVAEDDSGLDSALVGTATRTDGTSQVTYDGKPLYTYSKENPGEVTGSQTSFGGVWRPAQANPFSRQTTTGVSCEPNCSY